MRTTNSVSLIALVLLAAVAAPAPAQNTIVRAENNTPCQIAIQLEQRNNHRIPRIFVQMGDRTDAIMPLDSSLPVRARVELIGCQQAKTFRLSDTYSRDGQIRYVVGVMANQSQTYPAAPTDAR